MLQSIGDKLKSQRWLAAPLLGLLALIFAAWGAYGIVNISFAPQDYGLKVNGEPVSTETLNRAWQERQAQYAQALNGAALPPAQTQIMQQQLVEEYVRETVLRQRAQSDGYRASDGEVLSAYQNERAFQVDGKFSPEAAKNMLAQVGMTPAAYEAERRQALQISQLTEGIQLSDFLTTAELNRIFALENEQREVRYALLPPEKYAAAVKVDEAQIKAWYEAHPNEYMSPESVKLQYAVLALDSVSSQVSVKEEDLQAWYDKNKSRYSENEKRHAHHILIAIDKAKDPKSEAAALAKAQQVLAEVKSGKDFGELARKYSADPASAQQGGDLGWAEQNAYVAPFSDALFAMQPGQTSDPVKTQYGYHIIRLDEIRPAHVLSLADSRAKIETDYRRAQAAELFGDREEQLQQKLEQAPSTDLTALAGEFGMQLGELANFTRAGAPPLGSKPEVVQAVFSEEALSGSRIGGPVALADDRVALFKVLEHRVSAPQPLASVHDEVAAAVRKSANSAAAKVAADQAVKQLDGGADFDAVIKGLGVTAAPASFIARSDPQLPVQVRESAFDAPRPGDKPLYRALALDNGGAALLRLSGVRAGSAGANAQNDEQLAMQFKNRDRDGDMSAYLRELEQRASVKRNPNIFQ
jgi:peptidyl-prolyl cis-trans isomerase D